MNERLRKLIEARARVWEQMKEIRDRADENGLIRGEDEEAWNRANTDLDKFGAQIEEEERAVRLDSVDRSRLTPPPADENRTEAAEPSHEQRYTDAFWNMVRDGLSDIEPEQRKLLMRTAMDAKELRALGVGTGSAGGFTVPPAFRNRLVETMRTFGGMLNVAEVINTDSGANLQWPTLDDTANVGAILAENTQVTQQDIALGTASLDAYMYTSKLVLASLQVLQDSAVDVEGLLARKLGERIGRILNQHFTTGTGTSQPDGIVTGATIGKTGATGQTTSVTYDDLVDLIDSIDPAYQANARFMLSQGSRKAIRKLKDTQGRPLWEPSLQVGVPDSILGYGAVINQDMPAMAANAKSILFGDFREAYVIRLVTGTNLVTFNERYMDFLQRGFMAFQRADGTLQNGAAVRAYANSAT
ncbi:MAG: phage major capsid protein [Hamadaea sp.]|nr:phage major capsid protein [Catenulispora sp.]NUT08171.1 phage major capsid protein [Hamadaea sp.]